MPQGLRDLRGRRGCGGLNWTLEAGEREEERRRRVDMPNQGPGTRDQRPGTRDRFTWGMGKKYLLLLNFFEFNLFMGFG